MTDLITTTTTITTTHEVRAERSNWRDASYSARHRRYGFDCPVMDIDGILPSKGEMLEGVMAEYHNKKVVCFTEVKRAPFAHIESDCTGVAVLQDIADRCGVPLLGVEYWHVFDEDDDNPELEIEKWVFDVIPLNSCARTIWAQKEWKQKQRLSEREYVSFLYELRGRTAPEYILAPLCSTRRKCGVSRLV